MGNTADDQLNERAMNETLTEWDGGGGGTDIFHVTQWHH